MTVGVNTEGLKGIFPAKIYKNGKNNAHVILLYYKETKKPVLMYNNDPTNYKNGFTNDIDYGMPFYPRFYSKGKLYDCVPAIHFIDCAEKLGCQAIKRIAATLTDESNPIVIEATLK